MDLSALASLIPAEYLNFLSYAVTICAALSTILPKVMDTSSMAYKIIRAVIDTLALNFGNAKNAK